MDKRELDLRELLIEGASGFGVDLNEEQVDKFFTYKDVLKEWNSKMNLTAIEDDREIILKHFIDSISICPIIKDKKSTLIDVGTGAGFPGIPVKIAFPDIKIKLMDSLEKRTKFLDEVIEKLSLKEISAVHSRAEDKGIASDYREKYDISTARAVANLPVLLEYCLPFVRVGGLFIAMKGSSTEEIENSKKALDILGGKIEDILEFTLPFSDIKRNVVIIKKFRQTPTKYPRKSGKPSKDPLI
ncbi:16S rRNA (guanine(527)-N(7))-methyltransferase RsmG [Acetivibrio mesophilus]|uniref:Ribosomal RNA small subunit methyltransferase G n=1 Tax=Acetivibrio mesophilus TaxID=2487273 RepID=A0A4Q0I0S4_9FIRM|nr:16S rRNA (guanine(527)-N(7))-methyltransferase RsmG [Acetivibrio mesophilus]ODM28173.1 16S rRNA methyltransferase G [Clostridium sp. Bc-iso-3]RXE57824.1 16S rRNA (guanine(527)-N(7))-methyltransferase RsmG [Acetivibrio mesophilus]HHV28522.1 16S rRNA (guanine(527)-N(7))-methyltransferase RsmG [Clostridium sp.]